MTRRLLYYAPLSRGGMAEYAHEQANALVDEGVGVTLLCTPGFAPAREGARYTPLPLLGELAPPRRSRVRLARAGAVARTVLANHAVLAGAIREHGFDRVLFASYSELLAPAWSPRFRRLAGRGVTFGVVVHDPVRDHVAGPAWLHRRSVEAAYSFVREAFVHEAGHAKHVETARAVRATVVPQGVYGRSHATRPRDGVRAELGVPPGTTLLLAFGSIRDNKNLDLAIRALAQVPGVYLLVAGDRIWSGDRPPEFYQRLAEEVGVAGRCLWRIGFVDDDEVGNLFAAADLALVTYAGSFVSASAVANTAARHRTPLLASSGGAWLRDATREYGVGVWVPPDSAEAIAGGLREWLRAPPAPRWDGFAREHSWARNARIVVHRMWDEAGASS